MKGMKKGMKSKEMMFLTLTVLLGIFLLIPSNQVSAKSKDLAKVANTEKWLDSSPEEPEDLPMPNYPEARPTNPAKSDADILEATNGHAQVREKYGALYYGEEVVIDLHTPFYASADCNGSGKVGFIGNEYTRGKLRVCGFAILGDNGRLEQSECLTRDHLPADSETVWQPDFFTYGRADRAWVAIVTDGFTTGDIGWVPREAVKAKPSNPLSDPDDEELGVEETDDLSGVNPGGAASGMNRTDHDLDTEETSHERVQPD